MHDPLSHTLTTMSTISTEAGKPTPVTLPGSNLVVGHVDGAIFRKTVRGSAHFLRKPPAIAFDVSTLDAAERAGALAVLVIDSESGHQYAQRIEVIRRHGFSVNRGFGKQIALPIDCYAINGNKPKRDPGMPATNAERKEQQPGLFGGAA